MKIQKQDSKGESIWETISPFKNGDFEKQLLRFITQLFYGKNYHSLEEKNDADFSRADYFINGISCAKDLDANNTDYDDLHKQKILAFQNLNYFREKLERNISIHTSGDYKYLSVKPFTQFIISEELPKFNQLIEYFKANDDFIKNGVFEFIRTFSSMTTEKRINSFYTILVEDFFNLEKRETLPKIMIDGVRQQVKPIESVRKLPHPTKSINLIEPKKYTHFVSEDYIKNFAEEHYGSLDNMYKTISDAINS